MLAAPESLEEAVTMSLATCDGSPGVGCDLLAVGREKRLPRWRCSSYWRCQPVQGPRPGCQRDDATLLQHPEDGRTPSKTALWDEGCFLDSSYVQTLEPPTQRD